MCRRDRCLEILRVMIHAVEDHKVVLPSGDEKQALMIEAEIAGPVIAPRRAGDLAFEGSLGLRRTIPVAGGYARPGDTDLPDAPVGQQIAILRIGHDDAGFSLALPHAAGDESPVLAGPGL